MGLIRKSLAIGTVGVVNPSSKKQRVAKATQKAAEANARSAAALVRQQAEANRLAERRAQEEHEFRYATDEKYRTFIDEKREREEAERRAEAARVAEAARLRRERIRRRNAAIRRGAVRTIAMATAAAVLPVAAVMIWLPQFAVASARRQSTKPWLAAKLVAPFRRSRT